MNAAQKQTQCVVVGGGPGGMIMALLLARQGIDVMLLEGRDTFDRDYRGDSVHPSTLELMDELGLLDRLFAIKQAGGADFPIHLPDGTLMQGAKAMNVPSRFKETLNVPQRAFLELLAEAGAEYPTFHLQLGARVEELIYSEDGKSVCGVRYRTRDGWHEVRAPLVVGADGRYSKVRQLARISMVETAEEFDLLWMRFPKSEADPPRAYGLYPRGADIAVVSDRGDMWQVGTIVPKSGYEALRRAGIQTLQQKMASNIPWLADRVETLSDWSQTSLLVVQVGHVKQWYRPGLLLIGDAAHVLSPVFGVGINFAIQDAVAASRILGPRLMDGGVRMSDLRAVQRRREWPVRLMQFMQEVEKLREMPGLGSAIARWQVRLMQLRPMLHLQMLLIAFGGPRPERMARAVDASPLQPRALRPRPRPTPLVAGKV